MKLNDRLPICILKVIGAHSLVELCDILNNELSIGCGLFMP